MPLRRLAAALVSLLLLAAGAAVAAPFERGLLWRVERDGRPASHVYGTIHLDDARATAFSPQVDEALAASRALLVEMLDDADSRSAFEAAARLPPGRSLRTLAGPERFERVASRLSERYGLPVAATERLTPWAAYLTLSQPPRPQGEIVDAALQRIARQRGIAVVPLETAREQIASIAAVQTGHMLALLEVQARRHDEAVAAIDTLLARYLEEDLDGMLQNEEFALQDEPSLRPAFGDLFEQILVRRSARMVERMRPRLERGGAFVAIGALHLHGEQGVLALLERAGWRVQRIELQRP